MWFYVQHVDHDSDHHSEQKARTSCKYYALAKLQKICIFDL